MERWCIKKHQNFDNLLDGPVGTVQIGIGKEPICIPGNAMLTVPGNTSKIEKGWSYIVEQAAHHNLPHALVVNSCCIKPKAKRVPVILINTTDQNIWVRQPLLATELFEVEVEPQQYCTEFNHKGDEIIISFMPAPPHEEQEQVENNAVEVEQNMDPPKEKDIPVEYPKFGERPDTGKAYDFKKEIEQLPFKFNLGDAPFTKDQQDQLLNIIYDNQQVFSLHDEDLGFCNKLTHTIPTMTDRPVYLPHRTIPWQLQGEVYKCLDTWLRQGIIRPSRSPYASQVVIVRKKTGKILLCVNYHKLNSIVVRDAFPLPHIDEALQAVHNCQWFSSFDLAQGYLQMPVDEADIHKTAFWAGSSGLYEFTRMPFGLSNSGSSFCHLMEMCLGDQQFITLLLYLDNICIFIANVDEMLDQTEWCLGD